MAAGLAVAGHIFVDQLAVAHRAEAGEVAAVHDGHGKRAQAVQRLDIDRDVGMIGIIDQRSVIDDVARQEGAGLLLEQADAAGRMARRVDDLEGAVAQVDDIALFEDALHVGRLHMVHRLVPAFRLGDEHVVGGIMREDQVVLRVSEDLGFGGMHRAVAEFVVAADVVEMGVARDTGDFAPGGERHVRAKAKEAEAGIEQQVAVAASHVPDVAAEEGLDPRFVDQRHAIGEAKGLVPLGCTYAEVHGLSPSARSRGGHRWRASCAHPAVPGSRREAAPANRRHWRVPSPA